MIKYLKKTTRRLARKAAAVLRKAYAPYLVLDNYGTLQHAWTLDEAQEWLDVSSPWAVVVHRYTERLVVERRVLSVA